MFSVIVRGYMSQKAQYPLDEHSSFTPCSACFWTLWGNRCCFLQAEARSHERDVRSRRRRTQQYRRRLRKCDDRRGPLLRPLPLVPPGWQVNAEHKLSLCRRIGREERKAELTQMMSHKDQQQRSRQKPGVSHTYSLRIMGGSACGQLMDRDDGDTRMK